jgi:Fe-S-cluster containining protein
MKEVFDCRACGACCVCPQDQIEYCDLIETDLELLSDGFIKKNVRFTTPFQGLLDTLNHRREVTATISTKWVMIRTGPLKDYEMNYCAALRGSVMNRVRCSIYANRPVVCRSAVEPGDRNCKEIRRAFFQTIERLKESA